MIGFLVWRYRKVCGSSIITTLQRIQQVAKNVLIADVELYSKNPGEARNAFAIMKHFDLFQIKIICVSSKGMQHKKEKHDVLHVRLFLLIIKVLLQIMLSHVINCWPGARWVLWILWEKSASTRLYWYRSHPCFVNGITHIWVIMNLSMYAMYL